MAHVARAAEASRMMAEKTPIIFGELIGRHFLRFGMATDKYVRAWRLMPGFIFSTLAQSAQ